MAKLEIDLAPDEQAQLERQAEQAGLPITDWARQTLLALPRLAPATITTSDGEVYAIPDLPADLGRAVSFASEDVLKRFYDTPEEDAAWNGM